MDDKNFNVSLRCLFCDTVLTGKEDAKFESGDLIPCAKCGEGNDYDSVIEIAQQKGIGKVKDEVEDMLKDTMKNLFKK